LLEQATHIFLGIENNTKVTVYESTGVLGFSIYVRTVRFCYKYVIEYSHISMDVSILTNHVNFCTILLKKEKKKGLEFVVS
jgi:hypothetical protein